MNIFQIIIAFTILLLTVCPVLCVEIKSQPAPPFFVSRFYSLLKRLAWGLFFNGFFTGFTIAFLQNHTRMNQVAQGTIAMLQLTVVPVLLAFWAYRRPRVYPKRPFLIFPLLLGLLLVIDYWLTMTMLVSAVWVSRPISLAI